LSRHFGYRRNQRLGGRDIAALLAAGKRFKKPPIQVQIRENGLGLARLGLIVPKRFLPSSVHRNLVKRQAREWFRIRQKTLQGKDVVVRLTGPWHWGGLVGEILDQLGLTR
jgi:ribonuclease P protein component